VRCASLIDPERRWWFLVNHIRKAVDSEDLPSSHPCDRSILDVMGSGGSKKETVIH
jgi:hypothetical protein